MGRKSSHVTLAGLAALEAENKGAAPAATRASQLAPAAPALSARDAAMAAQEARDRVAEGRETLSRAKALLHPAGVGQAKPKAKAVRAKANGAKAAGPLEARKK